MRLSKTRNFKLNMGNYESYQFSATPTVDHGDLGYTDEEVRERSKKEGVKFREQLSRELNDELERLIELLILEDIATSRDLTEENRSMVRRALFQEEDQQPTPPATSQRRVRRGNQNSSTSRSTSGR